MKKLSHSDLMNLETYAEQRGAFRIKVLQHKKKRQFLLGPNASITFEDRLTIQYQVQEMLRIERIFEKNGINEELAAYNPLIPDGTNWKATFMIEYDNEEERHKALAQLINIEHKVWVKTAGLEPVYAKADEDVERATEEKTSAVHFLRFELPVTFIAKVKAGEAVGIGIDHDYYRHQINPLPSAICAALRDDLA